MKEDSDNDLISIGLNLGLFTFAKLFADEDMHLSQKGWEILRDHCADRIEEITGMPTEDLSLGVEPAVREMLKRIPKDNL